MIDVKQAGSGISGSVSSAKDMEGTPSWKITKFEDGIIYCSGKDERQLKVLKCANNELILQEDSVTYFFKQFK